MRVLARSLGFCVLALVMACAPAAGPQVSDPLLDCERADDAPVCLMRTALAGWSGDSPGLVPNIVVVSGEAEYAFAFAIASGWDQGENTIVFGPDTQHVQASARAILEALRLDAGGATPVQALAPVLALPNEAASEYGESPRALALRRLARWNDPLIAARPSRALRNAAIEAAGALRHAQYPPQQSDDYYTQASLYGDTGLVEEGRVFLRRIGHANDFNRLLNIGDYVEAERVGLARAAGETCPPEHRAETYGLIVGTIWTRNQIIPPHLLQNEYDEAIAALTQCGLMPSVRGPQFYNEAFGAEALRAQAQRFETADNGRGIALDALLGMYEEADDREGICSVARRMAAQGEFAFMIAPNYVAACQGVRHVLAEADVEPTDRATRAWIAGADVQQIVRLLRQNPSENMAETAASFMRVAHHKGRLDDEREILTFMLGSREPAYRNMAITWLTPSPGTEQPLEHYTYAHEHVWEMLRAQIAAEQSADGENNLRSDGITPREAALGMARGWLEHDVREGRRQALVLN